MSGQLNFDDHLALGEKLKERGIDAVEANSDGWVQRARRNAVFIAEREGRVTTDNLRRWADLVKDQPHSPHAWGAIFRGKGWVGVGYVKSTYGSNHGRRIVVWEWQP